MIFSVSLDTEIITQQPRINKHFACGGFIDLQNVFDKINHKIPLGKLEYYGIRGVSKLGSAGITRICSGTPNIFFIY